MRTIRDYMTAFNAFRGLLICQYVTASSSELSHCCLLHHRTCRTFWPGRRRWGRSQRLECTSLVAGRQASPTAFQETLAYAIKQRKCSQYRKTITSILCGRIKWEAAWGVQWALNLECREQVGFSSCLCRSLHLDSCFLKYWVWTRRPPTPHAALKRCTAAVENCYIAMKCGPLIVWLWTSKSPRVKIMT